MATRIPNAVRSAACDAVVDRLDLGAGAATIQIRTGTQPASANDAASGTLLATVTLADPAFGAAANGVATLAGVPRTTTGVADGDAGWFRALDSDGNTVLDGSVGVTGSGAQLEVNTIAISTGATVSVTAGTVTMPGG